MDGQEGGEGRHGATRPLHSMGCQYRLTCSMPLTTTPAALRTLLATLKNGNDLPG
ncbi:hypothetical protein ABIE67_003806 [Streptomyces sp. V4I8]